MSLCKYYFTNFSWNGKKMKKILGPAYYLKLKNIILFLTWGLFFSNGYIRNVISTLPSIVKIEVENDNVVSTSFNDVQFNVEIYNIHSTLFNVVNFKFTSTSTLIWRCESLQPHTNLNIMLNGRWNVFWE